MTESQPQSQTQLQMIENYKMNVQKVPTYEKTVRILKCACYSQCGIDTCTCTRWRSPERNLSVTQGHPIDVIYRLKCSECQHDLKDHLIDDVIKNEQRLNEMFIQVEDFEDIATKANNSEDCDLKQIFRFVATVLFFLQFQNI